MKRLLLLLILPFLYCGIASAVSVSGTVKSGREPLAYVVVTDGYNFAVTDAKGRYKMDLSPRAGFVYVAAPSGYCGDYASGTPVFYSGVETGKKKYDFDLVGMPFGNDYVMMAIADPQTQNDRHFEFFRSQTVPDLKNLAAEYSAAGVQPYGICLGDIVWDNLSHFELFRNEVRGLGIPFYPVIGNHDFNKEKKGDDAVTDYRKSFGPEYYAFNLGSEHYIVLNNIVYDTDKKYKECIDDKQYEWLEGYLEYIPEGSNVVVCMHCPVRKSVFTGRYMEGADRLLGILDGYRVRFMTGHTHVNSNFEIAPGVTEHNVASAGGAWWTAPQSKDGTPCGYQVFESSDAGFSWYYKSTGFDRDYQFELYDRGTFATHANAVVAKVWNWDPQWKVEWYEDGVYKGGMERFDSYDPDYQRYLQKRRDGGKPEVGRYKLPVKSFFYFSGVPSIYSKSVQVVVTDRTGRVYRKEIDLTTPDVQAHRGGMGLLPENTLEAMLNAVKLGCNTLEMDLQISRDRQVVVSHDPYMNYKYVTLPDGGEIAKARTREYLLYSMDYDSIASYVVGEKTHPDFPGQQGIRTRKPLLSELIDKVEEYTAENGYTPVNYNIEIKSFESGDGIQHPPFEEFADLTMEVLRGKNLGDRLIIQCFDVRVLNYMRKKYPEVRLAYLVSAKNTDFEANMARLDFIPDWYSPHHSLVNENSLALWHGMGMKVVTWTPDETADMERLVRLGVDAIITNYPDRLLSVTRKY